MKRPIPLFILVLSALIASFSFLDNKHHNTREGQYLNTDSDSENALFIDGSLDQLVLKTSNGCGIGNFLIPSTGDSSQGLPPLLGSFSDPWPALQYNVLDTLTGTHIKGIAFKRSTWYINSSVISAMHTSEPYVVVTDAGMFSYRYDEQFSPYYANALYRLDSITIPGIRKMANQVTSNQTNPIVLFIEDSLNSYSFHFYSYPNLQELFSIPFSSEPEIFEVTQNGLFVTAWDTNGSYSLYHYSTMQDTLLAAYTLNDSASSAQEFLKIGDSLFILSSTGDSMVVLSTFNIADSTLAQTVVYAKSGARATYNEFQNNKFFTFQPVSDDPDSLLDKKILILDPLTNTLNTLPINIRLDQFKYPPPASSGFGFSDLGWIGAKWQDGNSDSVFISDDLGSNIMSIETGAFPHYINATFGCWIGIEQNELKKIKFAIYPNPTSSQVTIDLTGLEKGRQYNLEIIDVSGKVCYTTELQAYQEIQIPVKELAKGLYFLNLDTGRNLISKKLIIQ